MTRLLLLFGVAALYATLLYLAGIHPEAESLERACAAPVYVAPPGARR